MSDIGKYLAIESDVVTLIKGTAPITGVLSVNPSCSMNDLIERDGIRKPAIGVIVLPTNFQKVRAIGGREIWVRTRIAVAVAITNMRGGASARPTLYGIFEALHDRVHYAVSSMSPGERYLFQSEVSEQHAEKPLLLGQAVYQLDLLMGQ